MSAGRGRRAGFGMCVCLYVCLSVCLSACLPACLPACLSVRLSARVRMRGPVCDTVLGDGAPRARQ